MKRRQARQARDRGFSDDESAARLEERPETIARWLREDQDEAKRAAAAQTPLDLITRIDREHREMLADLAKAKDAALAKGDTRTVIELSRERRHVTREMSELAARRGAFNNPLMASETTPEDDLDLGKMAEEMVKSFFKPGSDELITDLDQLADML